MRAPTQAFEFLTLSLVSVFVSGFARAGVDVVVAAFSGLCFGLFVTRVYVGGAAARREEEDASEAIKTVGLFVLGSVAYLGAGEVVACGTAFCLPSMLEAASSPRG